MSRCPFRKSAASIFEFSYRIPWQPCECCRGHFPRLIRNWTMPAPLAPHVILAREEQSRLEAIARAPSTPQALAFRCQVILRTAAPPRPGRPRRFSPLSPARSDGHSHPETDDVPLPRHALELGRPGDRPPAASHRDHESLEYLAHAGRGGPQTSSQRLLAQQPRPRL